MADVKNFLKLIKAMESSGGKDTGHATIEQGMHKGDAAVGEYGLMPNTVKEMAKKKQVGPSDDVITKLPNSEVSQVLKENPQLAEQYAKMLATKLMNKTQNDPVLGMTGWLHGHNMPLKSIEEKAQQNPEYVDKVNQRIDENRLQSSNPSVLDQLQLPYKDLPMSKKGK